MAAAAGGGAAVHPEPAPAAARLRGRAQLAARAAAATGEGPARVGDAGVRATAGGARLVNVEKFFWVRDMEFRLTAGEVRGLSLWFEVLFICFLVCYSVFFGSPSQSASICRRG